VADGDLNVVLSGNQRELYWNLNDTGMRSCGGGTAK
jgi:hypothetical protein